MRYLVGILLCLITSLSWAQEGRQINLFGGWASHNQESMEDSSTRPTGLVYGAGIGRRVSFNEFEFNISKGELTTDIEHDGESNTLVQEQLQFTLAYNFYVIKNAYARVGYSLTRLEQTTETPVSGASGVGLEKEYGLEDTKVDGPVLGAGWVFGDFSRINFYAQYEYFMMSEIKANQHLMTVGMRWQL